MAQWLKDPHKAGHKVVNTSAVPRHLDAHIQQWPKRLCLKKADGDEKHPEVILRPPQAHGH